MTNIKPLGQLVLIKKIEESEKTTASGLVLTAASLDNELSKGTIVAVGDGTRDIYGNMHPILLEIGETVYFNDSHLTEITDDKNEKYHFISSNNIYGKITNA